MENEKNVRTRRVKSFLMAMIIALSMVSFAPLGSMVGLDSSILSTKASAASNPYKGGYGNCTWTAWQLTYEKTGIALPAWKDAVSWLNYAKKAGYATGTKAQANSIAVYSEEPNGEPIGPGHVAFVTSVNGNKMNIEEGGYNGDYHKGIVSSVVGSRQYKGIDKYLLGFIYLNAKPSTPTNLSCIRPNSTSLRVSWSAVSGATKYYVYSSTSKDGTYKQIGTTTSTTYTNSGLTTGKTYYYKVRAYNSKGYSYYSSAISNSCAPTTVANVKVKKSGKGIEISWQTYSDVSGYYIYRSVNGENFEKYATIKNKSTSKYVDNVACGKKYSYYIRAYKTVGKTNYLGWYSSTQSYTVPGFSSVTFTKGKTSATVSYKMINPNGEKLTKVGIRIKKSNSSSWQKVYTENITKNSIATMKNPYGSYKIGSGSEVNFTLAKGTTYYVQMFCVIGGTEYTNFTYFKTNS